MAVVFAALTFAGSALAYGLDGKLDRTSLLKAAKAAGVKPNEVLATLEEARRKIADIEAAAGRCTRASSRAVARIVEQARMVLALVERKPSDLGRARRFFVTYLDGTRDVVARYAEQQHDVADTPLGQNFRRVLTTIEQVLDAAGGVAPRRQARSGGEDRGAGDPAPPRGRALASMASEDGMAAERTASGELSTRLVALEKDLVGDLQIRMEGPVAEQIDRAVKRLDLTDTNSIIFFGAKAQQELATISDSMLEQVRPRMQARPAMR